MKSLPIRIISAIVALGIFISLYLFFGLLGFKIVIAIGVVVGSYELMTILFKDSYSRSNKTVFYCSVLSVFFLSSVFPKFSAIIFAFFSICYLLFSMIILFKFEDLKELSWFQAKSVLGFFYMGLLPSFMVQIIDLPNGLKWFNSLLVIVFAGDIGAYFTGVLWGKRKIMPSISPKKTVEGSMGGVIFSVIAGGVCFLFFEQKSLLFFLLISFMTSIMAQFGDFFESVLKRVADVKDSGSIMPGHGGILDRVDGVLFAAPIVLFGALIAENLLIR